MRKVVWILLIVLLIISGCSSKKPIFEISEWTFQNTLTSKDVKNKLGNPSKETNEEIKYDDITLCDDVVGTLSFQHLERDGWPPASVWTFTTTGENNQYDAIHKYLNDNFEEWEKHHKITNEDGMEECLYNTEYRTSYDENSIYSIYLKHSDNSTTIIWGDSSTYKPK